MIIADPTNEMCYSNIDGSTKVWKKTKFKLTASTDLSSAAEPATSRSVTNWVHLPQENAKLLANHF